MALTVKKGWLYADTERVRLAAVTAYRPYADEALEITTTTGTHRFDLTGELEPQPALVSPLRGDEETSKRNRQTLDEWSARQRHKTRTKLEAALAALDDYFLKNP
jgi:hypothetical protein